MEWNRVWWEEFGAGKRLFTLTFIEGEPVALASFTVDDTERGRRLRFLGGDDLTDYLGPLIARRELQQPVAAAMLDFLKDLDGWDYFDAKCLPVPFGFAEWLVAGADQLALPYELELQDMTAVLALPDSFDDYCDSLAPKKRHELRRKIRRFEREAPGAAYRRSDDFRLDADIKTFVDLHRGSEGLKGKFMVAERATFFTRVAKQMQPAGILSLDFLEIDGKVAASTFSFEFNGVFYLYNSAYDHSLKAISPGLMLVVHLIRRSIEANMTKFDFLRGQERYKFDLGAEPLPLHEVLMHKRTSAART
ncbi:MAG: GNAT family N-acetyltransferase [Actinomycetota bacterium]